MHQTGYLYYNKFTHGVQIYDMLKFMNMDKAHRPAKTYLNHREKQRERILEAAEFAVYPRWDR